MLRIREKYICFGVAMLAMVPLILGVTWVGHNMSITLVGGVLLVNDQPIPVEILQSSWTDDLPMMFGIFGICALLVAPLVPILGPPMRPPPPPPPWE